MATVLKPPIQKPEPLDQSVILHNIRWATYECLLDDLADSSAPRLTYDQGTLQIMSPLPPHEKRNRILNLFVEELAGEWDLDIQNLGSTTFRREDQMRGFEPDTCFYIQNADALARDAEQIDLMTDPPPDLVIEIDITHPSLDKFPIYAALGIPEVWRDDGERVTVFVRSGDGYETTSESRALPGLTGEALTRFVASGLTQRRPEWLRKVRAWAREQRGNAGTDA